MKKYSLFTYFSLFILLINLSSCNVETKDMNEPVAKKERKELVLHGDTRVDYYYWLNQRENPDVIAYLEDENAYTKAMMKDTEQLQDKLYNEIVGRIKQTDQSVPYFENGYYYYTRYEEGKEYPIYARKKGSLDAAEEIMLNVNEMAEGHEYFNVSGLSVSPDNTLLAYGVDTLSRRKYTIHVKNLKTGEMLDTEIKNTTGYAPWAADNTTLFYTLKDSVTLRTHKIMKHQLGTDPGNDKEVFEEKDETFGTVAFKTKSDEYIMIVSFSTLSTEYQFLRANDPDGEFTVIQPRVRDLEYSVDHYEDQFYIVTNLDAKNFRLMKTSVDNPGMENWTEVIPHREDVYLNGIEIFNKYLVVSERKDGLTNLRVIEWDSRDEYYIDFGEEVYVAGISVNPSFNSNKLRYRYSSLTTPASTYDYNMDTREKALLKQQEVVGDFNPADYEAKRLYATASDGEKIPVSLVYKKGIELNGKNPALLYGYGSYGHTIDPYFSSVRLSLLDRGFVFVIAHIRGSQIYGRRWYEEGKLLKKKNTFTDFVVCAEKIIEENYTSPEHLFAMGSSAGGLLMGAVVNLRPELFKGVVAGVPFVDVVTTMLDETIPLTTGEFDEWGNPRDSAYYFYIKSYSPYDNVEAKDYPNLLVTTGLHDSQVQYWEPAKWVAKLRELKTDKNMLLLHTNMGAGHSGASGRFEQYKETALEYAFMLKLAGIKE
jgi:oligopeptidase B